MVKFRMHLNTVSLHRTGRMEKLSLFDAVAADGDDFVALEYGIDMKKRIKFED